MVNVFFKYFYIQMQVNAKPWRWHIILVHIKVYLNYKLGHGNVVLDVLSKREELQAINTILILWLMFTGKKDFMMQDKRRVYNRPKTCFFDWGF